MKSNNFKKMISGVTAMCFVVAMSMGMNVSAFGGWDWGEDTETTTTTAVTSDTDNTEDTQDTSFTRSTAPWETDDSNSTDFTRPTAPWETDDSNSTDFTRPTAPWETDTDQTTPPIPNENGSEGDINLDGNVSTIDLLMLKKHIIGIDELTGQGLYNADMNHDQSVTVVDAILLKNTILYGGSSSETTTTTTTDKDDTDDITDAPKSETTDATHFVFSENGVTAYAYNESGDLEEVKDSAMVDYDNNIVTISGLVLDSDGKALDFEFEGSGEGQIVVNMDDTYAEDDVTLSLQGLTLTCNDNSPIYVENVGGECQISAKKGTDNVISDGTSYTNYNGEVGAIYARDDIKFKGKGTLTVNGNCAEGIVCKNDIKIWNGTLVVNAQDDGIKGKDSVRIGDPDDLVANGGDGDYSTLSVTVVSANGDGIKSNEDDDEAKGYVTINGGTINVTSYSDGIQAERNLTVNGGDINITTTAPITQSNNNNGPGGGPNGGGGIFGPGSNNDNSSYTDDEGNTAKGMKAGNSITIQDGNIVINSTDNCIKTSDLYSNGTCEVNGGTLELNSSAGKGFRIYGALTINDGTITVDASDEGIESKTNVEINGGIIKVTAGDDGINAGGTDDTSGSKTVTVNDGSIYIVASGDVIDSNGMIYFNGGTTLLCRERSGGDSAVDASDRGGQIYINNGATLIALGASGDMWTDIDGSYTTDDSTTAILNSNVGTISSVLATNGSEVLSYFHDYQVVSGNLGIFYAGPSGSTLYVNGSATGGTEVFSGIYSTGGTVSEQGTEVTSSSSGGGGMWW